MCIELWFEAGLLLHRHVDVLEAACKVCVFTHRLMMTDLRLLQVLVTSSTPAACGDLN